MPSLIDMYQRGLRQAIRGLWNGSLSYEQATDAMLSSISSGLTRAFQKGALSCGIRPDEFTEEEKLVLQSMIVEEQGYIANVLDFTLTEDITLTSVYSRLNQWTKRFLDAKNQGALYACRDRKLIWELGSAEKHCASCPRLHGKVKRASFWRERGIHPQRPPNQKLHCLGYNCTCTLTPTDLPITPGPLPRLP